MVDFDIGDIKLSGPEVKLQKLFTAQFVGVVRSDHPLASSKITPKRYVQYAHISASRRGLARGPIDAALDELGLKRMVSLSVPTFSSALTIAVGSDLVAAIPEHLTGIALKIYGAFVFPLPVRTPSVRIALAWHPRFDRDAVHRFVRETVAKVCSRTSAKQGSKDS